MKATLVHDNTERMDRFDADGIEAKIRDDRGAVGTEMAIVVAVVVAIALALGAVMFQSAQAHQDCIPDTPGAAVPAGCNTVVGGG